jgi:predicted ArsR family transcriptional regulator
VRVEDRPDQLVLGQHIPHSGPETSREAARLMREVNGELCLRVLRCLKEQGPATDQEIQDRLSMDPNTQRPRRKALEKAHLIRQCGKRPTRSGRPAIVWEAC